MDYGRLAVIGGAEASFVEAVRHAVDDAAIVVCDIAGARRYVSETEWAAGCDDFELHINDAGLVTSKSRKEDKMSLFRSLFRGRDDVYAHGYAKEGGHIAYSPVCQNRWNAKVCPKTLDKGAKCKGCAGRSWAPLTDNVLYGHFRGESSRFTDVVGLYVMNEDCTTWVLVADFDGGDWQKEVLAYAHVASELGLNVAIERSRSGNGAHAWMFFSEPVPASLARNVGSLILTRAMSEGRISGFRAYDRFFPAQDTLTEDGLGNLIALPFQGRARLQGNSVFVDEDFVPYADQWRYLSSVKAVDRVVVERLLDFTADRPLGELAYEGGQLVTAAKKTLPTGQASLLHENAAAQTTTETCGEVPAASADAPLVIVRSGMLTLEKSSLSSSLLNRIRRLAAYSNPQFYRMQSLGKSVWGHQRIIDMSVVTQTTVSLPRGCESRLCALLEENGVPWRFEDRRVGKGTIRVEFTGELSAAQQTAADALLEKECGILQAPTGFGKTVVGAYLIGKLKMPTLVIVPNTALLSQWQEKLAAFLAIDEELPELLTKTGRKSKKKRSLIGRVGGGSDVPSGIVDIATPGSLLEPDDDEGGQHLKESMREYGLIICDECHHVAAAQYSLVLRELPASRVYGLSATPKRADGQEKASYLLCGPVLHTVDPKVQASDQGFSRYLRPRFTHIRLPKIEAGSTFNQVLDELGSHDARNQMIVDDAAQALFDGHRVLVMTKRKEHASLLAEKLGALGKPVFLLTGEGTAQEKRRRLEELGCVPDDEAFAVVATGSYLGEGFDDPRLDVLLLAAPAAFEGVVTQYSGRLHRAYAGKESVTVYDYVDTSVPMLDRMYKKRLKTFAKLGYEVVRLDDGQVAPDAIIDSETFAAVFAHDMETAEKTIVLAVPYLSERRIRLVEPLVRGAVTRGVAVSIRVTRASSSEQAEKMGGMMAALRAMGCQVDETARRQSAIAVFDGELFWYGSIPLLAFPQKDDCSLRYKNAEICHGLMLGEGLVADKA